MGCIIASKGRLQTYAPRIVPTDAINMLGYFLARRTMICARYEIVRHSWLRLRISEYPDRHLPLRSRLPLLATYLLYESTLTEVAIGGSFSIVHVSPR